MSVRKWKQVITIAVILIILTTTVTALILGIKYIKLSKAASGGDEIGDDNAFKRLKSLLMQTDDEGMEYKQKYENLYIENDFQYASVDTKVCYLTFDDGPNLENTPKILDALKEKGVKATFFVVYNGSEEAAALYRRIVDEGHTIGIHSTTHKYETIYSSVDAYLEDFGKLSDYIEHLTGVKPEIFRFPGGSINSYNNGIYRELIAEMTRRGYTYYDWNVSSGDAQGPGISQQAIINNVLNSSTNIKSKIVLMHDGPGHGNTANALPNMIDGLKEQGYEFAGLNKDVQPVNFGY